MSRPSLGWLKCSFDNSTDVIDLCDSDNEGGKKLSASEATKTASTVIVKKEAMVEEAWL